MTVPVALIQAVNRGLAFDTYRERAVKDGESSALIMRPSKAHRWFVLVVSAFSVLASAKFVSDLGIWGWWWPPALFCLVWLAISVMMLWALRSRVCVSERGVTSRQAIGREKFIAWHDVDRVRFREWGGGLRLHSRSNDTLVIPSTMSGTADLERVMRQKLPLQLFAMSFMKYRAYLKDL